MYMTEELQTQNVEPKQSSVSFSEISPTLKQKSISLGILLVVFIVAFSVLYIRGTPVHVQVQESTLSSSQNQTATSVPLILTEVEARSIAESACIKGGKVLGVGTYNDFTRTWWFDANLNATQKGCNPACVVDGATKTVEINWRCTGAIPPVQPLVGESVACTMDAKICHDGSVVGRIGPNCEFAPCSTENVERGSVVRGQRFLQKGVSITPLSVVEDSRCPLGVECLWAGVIKVKIRLESIGGREETVVSLYQPSIFFAGKRVMLINVSPESQVSKSIQQSEYRFEFLVQ
jgi:hypothetical protein